MHYSPLRYPGGKNKLSAFIANLCLENNIKGHYVEPYSGGASVALFLLLEGYIDYITINDKDRSLYSFWFAVLNHTDEFCSMIKETPITMEVWHKQRQIQVNKKNATLLELGFSTFFLNRTNRSGIISAGVIGGVKQNGNYLMDCRFNKSELINRIQLIGSRKKDIRLMQKDAIDLINLVEEETKTRRNKNTLFYFDPPYYDKGSTLYMNHYLHSDHQAVSDSVKTIRDIHWIVSYDNAEEIRMLYEGFRKNEFTFTHTAYESRVGKEIMFYSNSLTLPQIEDWNPIFFKKTKKRRVLEYVVPR